MSLFNGKPSQIHTHFTRGDSFFLLCIKYLDRYSFVSIFFSHLQTLREEQDYFTIRIANEKCIEAHLMIPVVISVGLSSSIRKKSCEYFPLPINSFVSIIQGNDPGN